MTESACTNARTNGRTKSRTNAQAGHTPEHAQMPPYVVGGIVCAAASAQMEPKASDLLRAAFDVPEDGVWVERGGRTVRGTRPAFLDWPSHTAADMADSAWPSRQTR